VNVERKVNILIVDDQDDNLLALEEVLRPLGQNIVRAVSGEEALKRLLTDEFAAILLDVQMPGMDGFETAARIKARERTKDIPIIFLTAISTGSPYELQGYEVGAVDYLVKPFDPWVLRSKVAVFIDLCNTNRALQDQASILREKTAELERARAMMRDFLAMATHDLASPIAVIAGTVSNLRAYQARMSPEEQGELIDVVARQAAQLKSLVHDLLMVSKLDAGAIRSDARDVAVGELIAETIDDLGTVASELKVTAPPGLVVSVDPDHLRRILRNCVENALRHGAPPVEIDVRDAGASIELRVRDGGEGVPETFVPHLFEKFARADPRPRTTSGSGLGLPIVRSLAEINGGEAWYEPGDPSGACFAVRLPKPA
jgi:signal transduction histidine kinase